MDTAAYFARIRWHGPVSISAANLAAMHRAHMFAVPFENLDIHRGRPISLDLEALFDKIVTRSRGGFCYELNGLFCALLLELGYRVTMLSSEVAGEGGRFSPPFDHLALQVDLDEPWLADVGFGDGFRRPLRLNDPGPQEQDGSTYRIAMEGANHVLYRRDGSDDWTPQYWFTLEPRRLSDFAERCRFHQTSPGSHFTRNRICTLARPDGRITLSGLRLIESSPAGKTERTLLDEAEYAAVLNREFAMIE